MYRPTLLRKIFESLCLKDVFSGHKILVLKMLLLYCLLDCIASDKKSAVIVIFVLLHFFFFLTLAAFKVFTFFIEFVLFSYNVHWCSCLHYLCVCLGFVALTGSLDF